MSKIIDFKRVRLQKNNPIELNKLYGVSDEHWDARMRELKNMKTVNPPQDASGSFLQNKKSAEEISIKRKNAVKEQKDTATNKTLFKNTPFSKDDKDKFIEALMKNANIEIDENGVVYYDGQTRAEYVAEISSNLKKNFTIYCLKMFGLFAIALVGLYFITK